MNSIAMNGLTWVPWGASEGTASSISKTARDVQVVELSGRLGLSVEACAVIIGSQSSRRQYLDGHRAVKLGVTRHVDDSHSTTAQLRENLVMG
ncbi:MAG: hypothetical protein ACI80V_002738 [Rhodothermales bacterium]|jgi:hypothetical protein